MLKDYVKSVYQKDYEKRLADQKILEEEILEDQLVISVMNTNDLNEFKELIMYGLTNGNTTVKIENTYSRAFEKLKK